MYLYVLKESKIKCKLEGQSYFLFFCHAIFTSTREVPYCLPSFAAIEDSGVHVSMDCVLDASSREHGIQDQGQIRWPPAWPPIEQLEVIVSYFTTCEVATKKSVAIAHSNI
jgi:hypothetical protein